MMPSDINTSAITSNVSRRSSISSISTHITSTSRDSGPMDKFVYHRFTDTTFDKFYYLLLKASISNGWSFRWVENPDSIALFKFINPQAKLPSRKCLGGKILKKASKYLVQEIQEKAKSDIHGVTITMDGWTNVAKQNILGSVLITSSGEVLIWKAKDISVERARTEEVKAKITELIDDVAKKNIVISAVVTDSHSSYAAAR